MHTLETVFFGFLFCPQQELICTIEICIRAQISSRPFSFVDNEAKDCLVFLELAKSLGTLATSIYASTASFDDENKFGSQARD